MVGKKISSLGSFLKKISFEKSNWYDYGYNYTVYFIYTSSSIYFRIPIKITTNEEVIYKKILNQDTNKQDRFFSIGNEAYYEFLSTKLTYEVKCQWLKLIKDVAFDINLFNEMKSNESNNSQKALLRGVNLSALNSLATMEKYNQYSNKVSVQLLNDEKVSLISIDSAQFPNLPSNTYAIIGKNGSGKTRFLNNLVSNYLNKSKNDYYLSDEVNSLVYISFSPFDFRDNTIYKELNGFKFLGIPEITTRTSSYLMDLLLPKMYSQEQYNIDKLYTDKIKNFYLFDPLSEPLDLKKDISKKNELMNYYYGLNRKEMIYFRSINNDNILLLELQNIIFEYFIPMKDAEIKLLFSVLNNYFVVEKFTDTLIRIIKERRITKESLKELMNFSSGQKILSISLLGLIMFSSNKSVILIDEPETFLHPPMVKQYIQSINKIAKEKNSICILTTHTPIVIQELPHKCVYSINDGGLESFKTKTFGEDFVTLYSSVYGLVESLNGYSNIASSFKLIEKEVSLLGRNAYVDWLFTNETNK